jgi:peptidoglycan/LPS O-acetylase OafA/YrhL
VNLTEKKGTMAIRTSTAAEPVAGHGVHSRLPSLTGMRFFAALLVFLFHSSRTNPPLTPFRGGPAHWYATVCGQAGWVGVSFFFVLSGFVLTWVADPADRARLFWRRRAVKIYPNHVVMFLVTMWLLSSATPWRQWLPNLLLVQTWVPTAHLDTIFSVDQPSWSLSCEIVFYLCFPLLYRAVLRIGPARLWAWAAGTAAAVFAVATFAQFALPGHYMEPVPGGPVFHASEWQVWVVYALPPVRMLEFVFGMLLARIVLSGRWINLPLLPAGLLALASYAASYAVPWTYATVAVCMVPLGLLIAAAATVDVRGRTSPFRGAFLVRLGEVSFAFYLVHGPVLGYLRGKIDFQTFGPWTATSLVLSPLVIAVTLAWLLHTLVERPMMRWFSRPSAPAPADAASLPGGPGLPTDTGAPDVSGASGTPEVLGGSGAIAAGPAVLPAAPGTAQAVQETD